MEFPTCMYSLPLATVGQVVPDLPQCMYSLGHMMPLPDDPREGKIDLSVSEQASDLESRQATLLSRLRNLQETVAGVRESLGIKDGQSTNNNNDMTNNKQKNGVSKPCGVLNLVVRASPSHPPYSLLCLISALKHRAGGKNFVLQTSVHEHSSLERPLPNSLKDFLPESDPCEDRAKVSLRVSLIWKEVGRDVEMGLGLTVIRGETNVMRYAARCLGMADNSVSTDDLVDECYRSLVWGDQKDQAAAVTRLEQVLAKRESVCDQDKAPGLMDFAIYSALVNSACGEGKGAVKKWAAKCKALCGKGMSGGGSNNKKAVGKESGGKSGGNPGRGWRNRTKSKSKSKTPPGDSSTAATENKNNKAVAKKKAKK